MWRNRAPLLVWKPSRCEGDPIAAKGSPSTVERPKSLSRSITVRGTHRCREGPIACEGAPSKAESPLSWCLRAPNILQRAHDWQESPIAAEWSHRVKGTPALSKGLNQCLTSPIAVKVPHHCRGGPSYVEVPKSLKGPLSLSKEAPSNVEGPITA